MSIDPIAQLSLATAAFLATHYVTSTPLRAALVGAIGERPYLGLYSVVALGTIVWMVLAYNRAPLQPLWHGVRYAPAVAMPIALILLVCGVTSRNPSAVMQQNLLKAGDPARGILRVTRHPIHWAIMLWAAAHLLSRGDLKSVIFFGGFLLLAATGTVLMDGRKARAFGADWERFAMLTSNVPLLAIARGRNRFDATEIGWKKPAIALALYALLFWLHPWMFGARPY